MTIVDRLNAEADLCENETASDIAHLLWEAAEHITKIETECYEINIRAEAAEKALAYNMNIANKTTGRAMKERNDVICALREKYSVIEIANLVGLTRQRVHQILMMDRMKGRTVRINPEDIGSPYYPEEE